jgi:phosphatidylserine/phosphatidylglycerophosphate/cardiolipin synthase-like enzyme
MFTRTEYFRALAKDIKITKKGDRVMVATMGFSPMIPVVGDVAAALNAAAIRGVDTNLFMDSFDFLINEATKVPGPLWLSPDMEHRMREPFNTRRAALRTFAKNGGHYTITNQPGKRFTFPFSGRSHIKAAIINDIVYVGGCNLNAPKEIDIMLRWKDARTANWLYGLLQEAARVSNVRESFKYADQQFVVDNKTRIFVDAGVAHQSVIFDEALSMIDNAKKWIGLTSQYFAPGLGTQALARAHKRGVKIVYHYSHPSMHGPIESTLHHIAQWRERQRLPADLFTRRLPRGQLLHAKILATENGVLVGSHNYGDMGVNVGTAEIALKRTDEAFGKRAFAFIEKELGVSS